MWSIVAKQDGQHDAATAMKEFSDLFNIRLSVSGSRSTQLH